MWFDRCQKGKKEAKDKEKEGYHYVLMSVGLGGVTVCVCTYMNAVESCNDGAARTDMNSGEARIGLGTSQCNSALAIDITLSFLYHLHPPECRKIHIQQWTRTLCIDNHQCLRMQDHLHSDHLAILSQCSWGIDQDHRVVHLFHLHYRQRWLQYVLQVTYRYIA